jgi:hypothetical protein
MIKPTSTSEGVINYTSYVVEVFVDMSLEVYKAQDTRRIDAGDSLIHRRKRLGDLAIPHRAGSCPYANEGGRYLSEKQSHTASV